MGLKNASILSGATVSSTGGTALAFAETANSVQNGLQLIVPADTDYATRRSVTVKVKPATLVAKTGVMSKDKKTITFVKPIALTSGEIIFNVIRIEREVHPSLSAAECVELNKIGAQILTDTDFDSFWATGSLA